HRSAPRAPPKPPPAGSDTAAHAAETAPAPPDRRKPPRAGCDLCADDASSPWPLVLQSGHPPPCGEGSEAGSAATWRSWGGGAFPAPRSPQPPPSPLIGERSAA